jgi:NAD+ kinase
MKYAIYGKFQEVTIPFERDDENPDVVFSFGGDGTMLGAIHKYKDKLRNIKFIGINTGRLGFYADYEYEELSSIYKMLINKDYSENHFNLLEYTLKNDTKQFTDFAVNDLAITNPIHTQIIDVIINNKHFETFRGTGILISPPTGSTAYNKSLGGSVIDPNIKAIQLTEIASINNRVYKTLASPLVLSEKSKIELKLSSDANLYLSVDGQYLEFNNLKSISANLSDKKVTFIVKKNTDFFDKVKRAFIEECESKRKLKS